MLKPGEIVDRYRVEDLLGRGGMAAVFKVRHLQLNSFNALKLLFITAPDICQRLIREGRVQASLRHPNIVAVHDVLEVDGAPALVMEFVDGPALDEYLLDSKPTFDEALNIFRGILLGIAHAHGQGVAHRDLKPANVLLAKTNAGIVAKVADFGLVKALDDDQGRAATQAGVALGTPNYMSPEQIKDSAAVDQRTDIFAMGCILYELLAGQRAFEGSSNYEIYRQVMTGEYTPIQELVPGLPRSVVQAIDGCLMPDRDERLSDCNMVFDLLFDDAALFPGDVAKRDVSMGTPASGERLQLKFADVEFQNALDDLAWQKHAEAKSAAPVPTPEQPRSSRIGFGIVVGVLFLLLLVPGLAVFGLQNRAGEVETTPELDPVADAGDPSAPVPVPVPVPGPEPEPEPDPVADEPPAPVPAPAVAPAPTPRPVAAVPVPPAPVEAPEPLVVEDPPTELAVEPEPQLPATATVVARGDAEEVWLRSGANEYHLRPGAEVAPGAYSIHVVFAGAAEMAAGTLTAEAGVAVSVTCSSFNFNCIHSP